MNCKCLIAAAALSIPVLMQAVPADPRVRTVENPDGTTLQVRVHGDEFFHFITDADRTVILEKDASGFYVPAMRGGEPLAFTRDNVEMMRLEKEATSPMFSATRGVSGPQRMATLDSEGRSNYPTVGEGNRSIVVLVEFQDVSFTVENPKEYFTRQLNEPGFSDYGGKGSALDYFKDVSNGMYVPQFDVYGPVKISKDAAYFKDNDSGNMKVLIRESLTALDDEVDFTNYDLDGDGTIDTVFFYYAGYGSADSDTETIWPHQYDYQYYTWSGTPQLRLDGKKMGPYACANELKGYNPQTHRNPWADGSEPWVDGIGTFVHEYSHVLGLPDLYDVNYDGTQTPGEWDIMANGPYNGDGCLPPLYSAYEQWLCRWMEFTDAKDGTRYDLSALGSDDSPSAVRIRIPRTSSGDTFFNEYFVIETRDNSKWDSCFPNPGLMVWRINYQRSVWANNSVNSNGTPNVEIIYADGENSPLYNSGNIYPGSPNELIPSTIYQWWVSPFITSISYDAESKAGAFDYNVITELPKGAPVLHDNPYADKGTARNFTLEWDPVEGADSYKLTIIRVSTGKCLGLYDEFNVGNVTKQKILSVAPTFWNNELEAYVRAVKSGLPCSDISNKVTFVPKDLPKGSAVEGVESEDMSISGGAGRIVAPEGARAFTLAGAEVPLSGLAPGVYLVTCGSRTAKVIVR